MEHNKKKKYKFSLFFLNDLLIHLPKKRKRSFNILISIFLFSSIIEALNVSLMLPMVSIFENISNLGNFPLLKNLMFALDINTREQILKYFTLSFLFISIICGLTKYFSIKLLYYFSSSVESDVREKIFYNNMHQSYEYHLNKNSTESLTIITQKAHFLFNMLTAYLGILSSLLLIFAITITLFLLKPIITFSLLIFISTIFTLIYFFNKNKLSSMSKTISEKQFSITFIFQEAFGFISEILLYSIQNIFIDRFNQSSKALAKNLAKSRIIGESPRIYLEYILIILFVILLYYFGTYSSNNKIDIALISLLGFAALKLLPLSGKIYNYYSTIKSLQNIFEDIMNILKNSNIDNKIEITNTNKLAFKKNIKLHNINFTYDNENKRGKVLNNFNFEIKRNSFVGIKGSTGKGKSTLIKILMCLIKPDEGYIEIDGVKLDNNNIYSWQNKISILPQKVFLNDTTILENIVLGEDLKKINFEKVEESTKIAEIYDFINSLPQKFNDKVGEAGAKVSGGQLKRIGLARTLYRDTEVIILDEPTNELDEDTELKIIKSLNKLKNRKTIIIISHNPEIISLCDQIIDFDN
jgi:ABC-type multidrug transport system fused ATPase/permease subunit